MSETVGVTPRVVAVGTTPIQVVTQNAARKLLLLQNIGGATIYLQFSGVPGAADGLQLPATATLLFDETVPGNPIQAVVTSGQGLLYVAEG
jgi:hypothetical protein